MKQRIIGFDLARAYAILGMFIVNFVNVFGGYEDKTPIGKFASLFNGNASSLFVILAGMGIALMTNRTNYTAEEKQNLKKSVLKKSWFLFFLGLLLYNWWPFDILHFYGGYMHIAAFILFVHKKWYLYGIAITILIYHLLFALIPYETGWDFATFNYTDFWTIKGFLRNSLYNGSNPIFPWFSFFLLGMYLGRLDWTNLMLRKKMFITSLSIFIAVALLQFVASKNVFSKDITDYILADYFPPFIPFLVSTACAGILTICVFMWIGEKLIDNKIIAILAKTGQLTLTNYIFHLTVGMILLASLLGKSYSASLTNQIPTPAYITMTFAFVLYIFSCLFTYFWTKKYKHGPLETLMRKISG